MYSRYSNRDTVQSLPEHYGGSAFSRGTPPPQRHPEAARPTPPPVEEKKPALPPPPPPSTPPIHIPPPHPSLPSPHPLTEGLSFDQLLLLGLILLLWGNERDGDVILWLGLLLLWQ